MCFHAAGLSRPARPAYEVPGRTLTLKLRGLHHNKITVAVARELAAYIWELARVVGPLVAEKAA